MGTYPLLLPKIYPIACGLRIPQSDFADVYAIAILERRDDVIVPVRIVYSRGSSRVVIVPYVYGRGWRRW